jgi:hypothetical protein
MFHGLENTTVLAIGTILHIWDIGPELSDAVCTVDCFPKEILDLTRNVLVPYGFPDGSGSGLLLIEQLHSLLGSPNIFICGFVVYRFP